MTVVNRWFAAGLAEVARKNIDLETDVLNLQCVKDTYTFNVAHDNISDLASFTIGTEAAVAGTRAMVGGTLVTDTAVTTIPTVPVDAHDVGGIVLWHDTSGTLLAIWQRQGDTTELVVVSDGGDVEVEFTLANSTDFEIVRI